MSSRFDMYLGRLHHKENTQRGIIIFDNSTYEEILQHLTHKFRQNGHSWGKLRNLSEVPLFIDSKASRMIQLADIVAFALFRYYNYKDDTYYNVIADRFDREGVIKHGLWKNFS